MRSLLLGIRHLRRAPRFFVLAAVPLTIGLAAALVVGSLGVRLYLYSLPVNDPPSLVVLRSPGPSFGSMEGDTSETVYSYPLFRSLAASAAAKQLELAARSGDIVSLASTGDAGRARAEFVSDNYFALLGLRARFGTLIDNAADGSAVVLSFNYAKEHFHDPASAIGKTVRVNNHPLIVIGVAPPSFAGIMLGRNPDVYLPLRAKVILRPGWRGLQSRRSAWLNLFGRFRSADHRSSVVARLNADYRSLLVDELREIASESAREKQEFLSRTLTAVPARRGLDSVQRAWAEPVRVLIFIAAALYGISWFNFGALFSVRLMRQRPSIAIQYSLGASQRHLFLPLAGEIGGLTAMAATGGTLLAWFSEALLARYLPPDLAGDWLPAWPDPLAVATIAATSLVLGTLLALVAAIIVLRDASADLRARSSRYDSFRVFRATGQFFLALQGAGTVALVTIALLLALSLFRLTSQNLGLSGVAPDTVVTASVSPELNAYTGEQSFAYYQRALETIRRHPGVAVAGITSNPIFSGLNSFANVTVEGYRNKEQRYILTGRNKVSTGFFEAVGIRLISGRHFQESDAGRPVVIINRRFAHLFFGNHSPEGRHVAIGSGGGIVPDLEVIGVVDDYHQKRLRELPIPALYTPMGRSNAADSATFYAQTNPGARISNRLLADALRSADPSVAVYSTGTLAAVIAMAGSTDRLLSLAAAMFGVLSLILALGGIAGILAYSAEARQAELVIRSALGATRTKLIYLLGRDTLVLTVVASLIGACSASVMAKLIESRLFGIKSNQIEVYAAAVVVYIAVASLVATLSAIRGSSLDLAIGLRNE